MDIEDDLKARSGDACELCGSTEDLGALEVPPSDGTAGTAVYACSTCRDQVSEEAPVEPTHWFGLKDTIWSEHPPVQVLSWRMLDRLRAHSWAADLLDQAHRTVCVNRQIAGHAGASASALSFRILTPLTVMRAGEIRTAGLHTVGGHHDRGFHLTLKHVPMFGATQEAAIRQRF